MKIGVIPPVPIEPFVASSHDVTNLWSAFFLAGDRTSWLDTARLAGFPDNFSLWSRCLYGMVWDLGIELLYVPEPGLPKEVGRVVDLLKEQDRRVEVFHFPLLRNLDRLKEEIGQLCRRLGVEETVLSPVMEQWQQVRTSLRRYDGLQQRTGAFASQEYLNTLARSMDPAGGLDSVKRNIEKGILEYHDLGQERWTRVGILGMTPYRQGLCATLEEFRAIVVYDEWGVENNPMTAGTDLTALYHQCSLPYGLKRRQERVLKEAAARRIRGFILGVEYLGESIRDEGFFRANLGLPVLTMESKGGGPLTSSESGGLERFVAACERSA